MGAEGTPDNGINHKYGHLSIGVVSVAEYKPKGAMIKDHSLVFFLHFIFQITIGLILHV